MRSDPSEIMHVPVLLQEVIEGLRPQSGGRYLDATIGLGGHAEQILIQSSPDGFLYGLDWDAEALEKARSRLNRFGNRVVLIHIDFKELDSIGEKEGLSGLDGLLFDLGLSSLQLESAERGFAFSRNGPLDMRMDQSSPLMAADLVNRLPERELADTIWRFGEERWARRIARRIAYVREKEEIASTRQLAEIITRAIPHSYPGLRIHPATRTFQALRIAVNRELEHLEQAIRNGIDLLRSGGRIAVISYHSLEDRIMKQTLLRLSHGCDCPPGSTVCLCKKEPRVLLITKKPITPGEAELKANPRSRSAKLRIAEKVESLDSEA